MTTKSNSKPMTIKWTYHVDAFISFAISTWHYIFEYFYIFGLNFLRLYLNFTTFCISAIQ